MKTTKISKSKFRRMLSWGWMQKAKTPTCPNLPTLTNKIVAITGGNSGIGLETVKGLLARGAEVIILSRNGKKSEDIIKSLNGKVHFLEIDLGNIRTIEPAVLKLKGILNERKIDILINNAGIALQEPHRLSPQGYEMTFAVNVLGHHILFKECQSKLLLTHDARIISVAGDIYMQADDCTPNYKYEGKSGVSAYSRSKVGVMWWAFECYRLYPDYKVVAVHPGVVPLGLGANENAFFTCIMSSILLSPKGGAQMSLICATQPNIESGAYYHNTLGKTILPENDIALNKEKSKNFWHTLEDIYAKDL
ncbi:SDR family NAD(P)-dependent oxidoreductase [Zobellia barbeyronii]|uniref:SDR family NAD(P)-dependent oxidoreductase n=1 Tax=Zobellia barbeyronii TaxID=2748009 RepID=A0ABS5WBF7_9FLAO|nr:SDR family NAD(P)-dependent oxidoreductase [Zobellia barbeyronii]MBT2160544.1 SDR family NAD(P)-dependent oxidoreductase [Zobellia barbeyronii]